MKKEIICENGLVYTKQTYSNGTIIKEDFTPEKTLEIAVQKEEQGEDLKLTLLIALKNYLGEYLTINTDVDLVLDGEALTTVQANENGIVQETLVLQDFEDEDVLNLEARIIIDGIEVLGRWNDGEEE